MKNLIFVVERCFSQLGKRNKRFMDKIQGYKNQFKLHESLGDVTEQKVNEYVSNSPKQRLAQKIASHSNYDKQLKNFIDNFNTKHKDQITLLDFSQYTTEFGQLKNVPLKKSDIDVLKQFQKRKIDQRLNALKQKSTPPPITKPKRNKFINIRQFQGTQQVNFNPLTNPSKKIDQSTHQPFTLQTFRDQGQQSISGYPLSQGPLKIKDNFILYLLHAGMTSKSTTLNRINTWRVLMFMGNGAGIISRGVGKDVDYSKALHKCFLQIKKNIIAIPRDPRLTVPLELKQKFQDYRLFVKPIPGFNSWGHPVIANMLTSAGMDHCRFHVAHTQKNIYNVVNVFYKAFTKNTTPKQLAERQGFKVYRHQFIRPLTEVQTHKKIAGK